MADISRTLRQGLSLFACAAFLAGCINSDPARQRLDEGSTDAVLLMQVRQTFPPYMLLAASFDEARQDVEVDKLMPFAIFKPESKQTYVAQVVKPGSYAFHSFVQQSLWRGCLQDATWSFHVGPGEILYLGQFDPSTEYAAMTVQAMRHDDLKISSITDYFEGFPRPHLTFAPDREKLKADVETYVKDHMPKVHGTVTMADYHPASFKTGYAIFHERTCGGPFFKGDGK